MLDSLRIGRTVKEVTTRDLESDLAAWTLYER